MAFFLRVTVMVMAVIGLTSAGCPPLWTRYRSNCYRFMGREVSWTDAENNCHQFFTISGQGHLASVHSSDEDAFLIQYLESSVVSADEKQVWIGLSDQSIEGNFSWSDGTALDYEGWLDYKGRQPDNNGNEDCGEFLFASSSVKGWNDNQCNNVRSYVCKMPTVKSCF